MLSELFGTCWRHDLTKDLVSIYFQVLVSYCCFFSYYYPVKRFNPWIAEAWVSRDPNLRNEMRRVSFALFMLLTHIYALAHMKTFKIRINILKCKHCCIASRLPRMMPGVGRRRRSRSEIRVALSNSFPRLMTMTVMITGIRDRSGATVFGHCNRAESLRFRGPWSLLMDPLLLHVISGPDTLRRDRRGKSLRKEMLLRASRIAIVPIAWQFLVEPGRPD